MFKLERKSVPCYKIFKFLYENKSEKRIRSICVFKNFPIFSIFLGLSFNVYDGHNDNKIRITSNMLGNSVKSCVKVKKKSKNILYVKKKKRY